MLKFYFDLSMFDGAAAGSDGGEGGPASHSSGEDSGQEVVYGKQSDGKADGDEGEGSDDQVAAGQDDSTEEDADSEFEELIKGKFKEQYGKHVQDAINHRFKNQQDLNAEIDDMNDSLTPLYQKYDIEYGDFESLAEALGNDDSLFEAEAEERGMSVDELKYIKELEADQARNERVQRQYQQKQQGEQQYAAWMQQAQETQKAYPNFNLQTEVQNDSFLKLLDAGLTVTQAYEATHAKDIIANAVGTTAEKVAKQTTDTIRSRGLRPQENGQSRRAGTIVKDDVSKLTDADIAEVIRRAEHGEKITF